MKVPKFLTPEVQARLRVFTLICNLLTIAISGYTIHQNRQNRQRIRAIRQACDSIDVQLKRMEK